MNVIEKGTFTHKHVNTQGTLASAYLSTQDTLTRDHVSTQGTFACAHVFSTPGTQFSRVTKKPVNSL